MQVRFDTSEYRFNHGRAPRGHGAWAFKLGRDARPLWTPGAMSYGAAKRWVLGEINGPEYAERFHGVLYVCS